MAVRSLAFCSATPQTIRSAALHFPECSEDSPSSFSCCTPTSDGGSYPTASRRAAFAAMALWLAASALATPLWPIARGITRQPLKDRLMWASMLAMGSFSSLFVLTLLRDASLFAARLFLEAASLKAFQAQRARRASARGAATRWWVSSTPAGARRYGASTCPSPGCPGRSTASRIAQITDLHVGPTIERDYMRARRGAVERARPDIIAITGDLVDGSVRDLAPPRAPLARLRGRHGAFFVTGNHEYYSGAHDWIEELRALGVSRAAERARRPRNTAGAAVVVAGVTDYSAAAFDPAHRSDPPRALAGAPERAGVSLLLAHQPRRRRRAARPAFDLQLSGHTHGGQFFPCNFFVRLCPPVRRRALPRRIRCGSTPAAAPATGGRRCGSARRRRLPTCGRCRRDS